MPAIAIVDSGPFIAAANRADKYHPTALAVLRSPELHFVVPALCVAEVTHILGHRHGPGVEATFLKSLEAYEIRQSMPEDFLRMAELVEKYADLPLGGVDASVVALAERLETDLVLTTDHRHFRVIRPRHCQAFRLVPDELPR